jgi:hypothetical protein
MVKNTNNNTAIQFREEKSNRQYLKFGDRINEPTDTLKTTRQILDELGYKYINWCIGKRTSKLVKRRKYFVPVDFLYENNILYDSWDDWQDKDEKFKSLVLFGNEILGAYREAGVAEKDFDSYILRWQRYYSRIAKITEKQISEERKLNDTQSASGIHYVLVEKEPESEIVTQKLNHKNESRNTDQS